MYLELSTPDKKTLKLNPYQNDSGIFNKKIASFTSGNYMLRIIAKGMTFERQKTFVFNIASAKEAKEEIKFEESIKETEKQKDAEDHTQPEAGEDRTDEVSWTSIIVRFIILNLVICIAGFVYFKRKEIKNLNIRKLSECRNLLRLINISKITALLERKKESGHPEEQSIEAAPEEAPRLKKINEETPEIHEAQQTEAEPQKEVTQAESPEHQNERQNEISLDDIEPEQGATQEKAPENQDEHQNEISLDDTESEQEVTAGDNPEEKKGELSPDNAEQQKDMKEGQPGSA